MTARITSRQNGQILKLVGDVVASLNPSKEDTQQRILARGGIFQRRLKDILIAMLAEYFILLPDEGALEWMRKRAGKDEAEAKRIISGYRRGAQEHDIADEVPCHILVMSGVTTKQTIPTVGSCWDNFNYLQNWDFPDPPTEEGMFSLIPTLLRDSTRKNVGEQRDLLAQVRRQLDLPENHLAGFGPVTHLAGAALTHKTAGRDIFADKIVRTETCDSDGRRLSLYWNEGRLCCGHWIFDGERSDDVGVLACGVEKALGR